MNQLDTKTSYIERLERNKIYKELKKKCATDSEGADIMALVHNSVYYSSMRTKLIVCYMKQYTLHDELHLFRVFSIMELLIPEKLIMRLSIPELMLLILSAFFHDLGMAPSKQEFEEWNKCFDLTIWTSDYDSTYYNEFKGFCESQNYNIETIIALYSNSKF